MTNFVQLSGKDTLHHEGAERALLIADAVSEAVVTATHNLGNTRNVSTVILSAIVSALLFASDKLVNDWSNGSMLLAWVTLWCVAFLALSLLSQPVRRSVQWLRSDAGAAISASYKKWQAHRAAVRADEAMWAYAQLDPRLMAEIQARLGGR